MIPKQQLVILSLFTVYYKIEYVPPTTAKINIC